MHASRLLATLFLTPIFAVGAQASTGRIVGTVKDAHMGKPLAGAIVTLSSLSDTSIKRVVQTDSAGRYSINHVERSRYVLRAEHERLEDADPRLVSVALSMDGTSTIRKNLGGALPWPLAAGRTCGEGVSDVSGAIETTGETRTAAGGAATLAVLRPGDKGPATQYSVVDACKRAPLSEQKRPPLPD